MTINTLSKLEIRIRAAFTSDASLPTPTIPVSSIIDVDEPDTPANRLTVGGIQVGNTVNIPFDVILTDTDIEHIYTALSTARISDVSLEEVVATNTPHRTFLSFPLKDF